MVVGAARTTHEVGSWSYVVTLNATDRPSSERVNLADLGVDAPTGRVAVWDWRTQICEVLGPDDGWDVDLASLDWDYRVVAPIVDGVAVIGDPSLYATAGDMRIGAVEASGRVTVLGAGETVDVVVWSEANGVQRVPVDVARRGWTTVQV